jgi:hypothetical protein
MKVFSTEPPKISNKLVPPLKITDELIVLVDNISLSIVMVSPLQE